MSSAGTSATADRFRVVNRNSVEALPQWQHVDPALQRGLRVVSTVLPFRTNRYVVDELIDWDAVPNDPMFRLTFPHRDMLETADFDHMADLIDLDADREVIQRAANQIRNRLNPHPAGQMTDNVPMLEGQPVKGIQHKYRETVLLFPSAGQTCHAYCTYCFRWAQFVGRKDLRFAAPEVLPLIAYLERNPDVTDILVTGGDPLIMKTATLRRFIEPLLAVDQVVSIRIGSKALAYWPKRFVTDNDADDLLRLFEEVCAAGKHLALMAHFTHPVELSTAPVQQAIRRIRDTGANIRLQSPIVRHVNDHAPVWIDMWRTGVRLGCVPYYMFIARDTGAQRYFEIPLARCFEIFRDAYAGISGLARTVRGPSMSATPGKVHILGVAERPGADVFVLQFLQARDRGLVRQPFFARFDAAAMWFDDLVPATAADEPFFGNRSAGKPVTERTVPLPLLQARPHLHRTATTHA